MKTIFVILITAAASAAGTAGEAVKLRIQAEQLCLESRYAEAEPIARQAVELWSAMGPEEKRNRALAMADRLERLPANGGVPLQSRGPVIITLAASENLRAEGREHRDARVVAR